MAKSGFQFSAFCKSTLKSATTAAMPSAMDTSEFPPLAAPSSKFAEPITPRPKITLPIMGGGKILRIIEKPTSPTPEKESVISAKISGPAAKKSDDVSTTRAVLVIRDTEENLDQETLVYDISAASKAENEVSQEQTTSTKKSKNKKKKVELSTSTARVQDAPIIARKKSEKKKGGQAPKMAKLIAQSQKQVTKIEQQQGMKKHVSKGNIPSLEKAAKSLALSQLEITCSNDGTASDSSGRSRVCSDDVDTTSSTDNTSTSQPARLLTQNEKRNQKSYARRKKRAARNRAEAEQAAEEAAKATATSSELINKEIGKIITHIRKCAWDHEPDEDDLAMLQFSSLNEQKRLMQLAKEDLHHDMLPLYLLGIQLTPTVNKYALAPGAKLTSEGGQMMRAIMKEKTGSFVLFCDASYRVEIGKRMQKMPNDDAALLGKTSPGQSFSEQDVIVDFTFEAQPSAVLASKQAPRHGTQASKKSTKMAPEDSSSKRSTSSQAFPFSSSNFTFTSTPLSSFSAEADPASTLASPSPALVFGGDAIPGPNTAPSIIATPQAGVEDITPMDIDTEVDTQGQADSSLPASDHANSCSETDFVTDADLTVSEDIYMASISEVNNTGLGVSHTSNVLISPASPVSEFSSISEIGVSEPLLLDHSAEESSTASEDALPYVPVVQYDGVPITSDSPGEVKHETNTHVKASTTDGAVSPDEIVGATHTTKVDDALDIGSVVDGFHLKDLHTVDIVPSSLDAPAKEPSKSPQIFSVDLDEDVIDRVDATHDGIMVVNSEVEALEVVPNADSQTTDAEAKGGATFVTLSTLVNVGCRDEVKREPMFNWLRDVRQPSQPAAGNGFYGMTEILPSPPVSAQSRKSSPVLEQTLDAVFEPPVGRPILARRRLNTQIGITTLHEYLLALPNLSAKTFSKLELVEAFLAVVKDEREALALGGSHLKDAMTVLANKVLQHKVLLGHIKLATFLEMVEIGTDDEVPDHAIVHAWEACAKKDAVAEDLEMRFYNA
ncbi:hypothetical protein FB567DRAFT_631131 [Paraphoma chrysanthemicola]|uniref:Uncharacterized protein n=1 Tax=Paraphoma chrysanthemicola TaxID=798071 RepID=A0A8K0R2U9_9PLEO|nr:hypothetical protein FB567DRAFT_631131 [Paraphoma chrysanthemicola]